jgi:hypothetical protein
VRAEQVISITCVGNRTAELCFFSKRNKRAGAQPELSDGETRGEGDKCTHGPPARIRIFEFGMGPKGKKLSSCYFLNFGLGPEIEKSIPYFKNRWVAVFKILLILTWIASLYSQRQKEKPRRHLFKDLRSHLSFF